MTGAEMIAAERERQTSKLGWTAGHDDQHDNGELALAAVCYATPVPLYERKERAASVAFMDPWPWEQWEDHRAYGAVANHILTDPNSLPSERRIKDLVRAGALIAAEIDRLIRKSERR